MRHLSLGLILLGCGGPAPDPLALAPLPGEAAWEAAQIGPLLVVDDEAVELRRRGSRAARLPLVSATERRLRRVTTLPLRLHRALTMRPTRPLRLEEADALRRLGVGIERARAELPEWGLTTEDRPRQAEIFDACKASIDAVLRQQVPPAAAAATLAAETRGAVEANARALAKARLEALHRAVTGWWAQLPPTRRPLLRVVVRGPAGARAGHWAKQYAQAVLGLDGEGPRLIYLEAAASPESAVRARAADELLGIGVFQDPERLRRDLLADGARAWLAEADYGL